MSRAANPYEREAKHKRLAWAAGYRAQRNGEHAAANPYRANGQALGWQQGYQASVADVKRGEA